MTGLSARQVDLAAARLEPVPEPVALTRATVAAIEEHVAWMRLRGLREDTTIRHRLGCLERLARVIGGDLLTVTDRDLAAWQRGLSCSAQSHNTYVAHVQEFYRWAVADGLLDADPTGRLVRPKIARRLPRPIGEEELMRAVLTANPRMRAWLVLAAWAGLRAMELAALRREDFHEHDDPPMLVVRDGKGQKGRAVPLSRLVVDELQPALDRYDPAWPWLFPSQSDKRRHVHPGTVSNLANQHLRALGIPDTLHSLRHRFASELYRVTLDLRLTQEMLGHASPATTAIYTAFSPTRAAAAVQEMGR